MRGNRSFVAAWACAGLICALATTAFAAPPAPMQQQAPQQAQQQTQQQAAPPAGGPTGTQGPIIIPKKKPAAPQPPPPPPPQPKSPEFNFSVNVPEVDVPVIVETKHGDFVPHLKADNFRVFEDGVAQKIDKVSYNSDAPMTVVMLVEFRNQWWAFTYQILEASYYFTQQLQPQDWVALVTYDIKPTIVVDFTHDKRAVYAGLQSLQFPGFSEANLFDSLGDTIDRLQGIKGHKIIVLITDGVDTFSHMTFDQIRKKVAAAQDITIYPVSIGWALREYLQTHGYMGSIGEMTFLQADNELQYFAKVTGGQFYQPRFEGGFNDVFRDIADRVRNQYIIAYRSSNPKLDGTFRKLKVEVVAPSGQPLKVVDQKGKQVKFQVVAKNGYYAPHAVE